MTDEERRQAEEAEKKRKADEEAKKKADEEEAERKRKEEEDAKLGEGGRKAIEAEREARKKAEKDAKDLKARLDALELADAERKRKEAEENGNYKSLYEETLKKLGELDGKVKDQERRSLRERIAGEYKLPAEIAERLAGETEAELKADAEKLAKVVQVQKAPDTELNGKGKGGSEPPTPRLPGDKIPQFSFVPQGAVVIPE